MGRPLAKRFFGGLNRATDGTATAADADFAGQTIASVTGTAGAITAGTATLQFPIPLLAGIGAVRATGTALYTPTASQITVGGTQTQAYSASDVITQATTGVTYTPTLTTYSSATLASATAISGNALTLTASITAVKGTSFLFPAGVTGVTGLTPGTTYYIAASVSSSTTVTLAATPTGSVLTISGTPAGTLTGVTIGASLASIASVVYASGYSTTVNTTALATTASVSAGAGLTLATTQWSLTSATITNAGDGYLTNSTPSTAITASTAGAALTLGTVTVGTSSNWTFSTAQSAGTFWVGQVITVSGTISGTTWTNPSYTTGNSYIVTATNGTSTVTLQALNNTTGVPRTDGTTTAGTVTGLTFTTAGTLTMASVDGIVATGQKLVTTGTGGSSGVTAGTYHVIAVNGNTKQISIASSYANFFTSTPVAITTAASIASTTAVGSQHLVINVTGLTGSTGTTTAVLATASGTQGSYGTAGEFGTAFLASAWLPSGTAEYQDADILKQKGTRRYLVETPDGTGVCQLTSTVPLTAGFMTLNATDSAGNTYYVTKLTRYRATLTRNVLASGQSWQFSNDASVQWVLSSAVANVSVVVDNG